MNSAPKFGDMQSNVNFLFLAKKGKISSSTGLPPLHSPKIQIDPINTPRNMPAFRLMSSVKKQSLEKKEENQPNDNTQKQKTYSMTKKSKQGLIIRRVQNQKMELRKTRKQENFDQIELKFQSPAVRMLEFPINDFQDDTIIKDEVQQSENQENRLMTMKNQSSSSSQKQAQDSSVSKQAQESSSNSQFEFSEAPTFTEGEMIGSGSFGQVFLAQENKTGKIYAVKKINLEADFDQEDFKGLEQEIELMKRVKHKNILRYVWNCHDQNYWLLYLEYLSQGTLTQLTEKYGALQINTIRSYSEQILQAIVYLHENNIIHRDIKGANLLLGLGGEIKLGDFGCSKIKEKTIQRSKQCQNILHSLKGSIPYMAPEVASQEENCRESDIWSFGCTVLEMATGQKPWHDHNFDNPFSALLHIIQEEDIPTIPKDLDPNLESFISQCLKRDHKQRPTALQLLSHQFIINKNKEL